MTSLEEAHKHCRHNKRELDDSNTAGCFYCFNVFNPGEIKQWVDTGTTALCPKCGIDSVIGSASDLEVDDLSWLQLMYERWFSH